MNNKLLISLSLTLILFVSCSSNKKEILHSTYEEIIQDLNSPINFNKKYRNKDVYITGIIKYIGEPKDSVPNTNASYIEFAGKNDISVIVYFDYIISEDVKVDQKVNVKCSFRKLYKANHFCNEDLVEFNKGKLIKNFY